MKYVVDVNGERIETSVDAGEIEISGERLRATLTEVEGTPVRLVSIGDEVHRVVVRRHRERGKFTLWIDGYRYEVEALDERTRTIRDLSGAKAGPSGPAPLVAPMPGLVVRVAVAVGDVVHAGQALVVMEAMKMENELRSSAAGTVKAVIATAGTAVEKGTVLVELE